MSNEKSESYKMNRPRRGPGGMHGGMMPGEKAKDFKGTASKLISKVLFGNFFLMSEDTKSLFLLLWFLQPVPPYFLYWGRRLWAGRLRFCQKG